MGKGQDKVLLSSVKSLAFFSEEYTTARRSHPIPQITCKGKICDLYQPEAVHCVNIGGDGADVNWKCEADLPNSLRFGKVTVSCEGWSHPGDEYVLKGSCGLEYSLARVPQSFANVPFNRPRTWGGAIYNLFSALLFYAVLIYFGYLLFKSCVTAHREANGRARRGPGGGGGNNEGWSNWFGGGNTPGNRDPPPPYYKQSPGQSSNSAQEGSWTPGFWTGLGLGSLTASLWNSRDDANATRRATERAEMLRPQEYDWERAHTSSSSSWFGSSSPVGRSWSSRSDESDRAGPSSLGVTRRSVAIGNSRVR